MYPLAIVDWKCRLGNGNSDIEPRVGGCALRSSIENIDLETLGSRSTSLTFAFLEIVD